MYVSVFARYGRTGLYQMRELMRLVNEVAENREEEIEFTKDILKILPPSNWFKKGEALTTDHLLYGDAGTFSPYFIGLRLCL